VKKLVIAFLLGVVLTLGCQHVSLPRPLPQVNHVDVVGYNDSLAQFKVLWQKEAARRFPDCVIIQGHGNDNAAGEWCIFGDRLTVFGTYVPRLPVRVVDAIADAKAKYPGRQIVLIVCNVFHHRLDIPGVAYAGDSVWIMPDRSIDGGRSDEEPGVAGNIFEFLTN
jgi:hypothetical protein